ncbi:MAG: M13-type metalloendopeptidase [Dokdonella sp.]|uniref:M13 family metallopeptidase n=1 Tax=Dokdonella sp. TaxID=2291710 RepID=UPI0032666436
MKAMLLTALCVGILSACSAPPPPPVSVPPPAPEAKAAAKPAERSSGIQLSNMDTATRAQDDFYRHVNGHWLDSTDIPADKPSYGSFAKLADDSIENLRRIIEASANAEAASLDIDQRKIGDLYAGFLDEAAIESTGIKPLESTFARIDAMRTSKDIAPLMADLGRTLSQAGTFGPSPTLPVNVLVHQDNKDATKYIADLQQSGLGLPDRDYYLKDDDAKLKAIRAEYVAFLGRIFSAAGDAQAEKTASDILALETALAKAQWTKVELRDPIKAYNKMRIPDLAAFAPGFDWNAFLDAAGIKGKVDVVNVAQPSYLKAFAKLSSSTPLSTWKAYFRWKTLRDGAPNLSKRFVDASFAFYGTTVRGVPENQPRWKRGVGVVEKAMGEALGKLYVAKYFPVASKQRADALVKNLLAAYKQGIDTLDWMSADTKREAQAKLAKFMPKIGYPDTWRDYSKLEIAKGDLIGNVARANAFEYDRNIGKLGQPVDRSEWGMTPQTINAYYNPELNEIVFPAAILQPPFFNPDADDAVNYGAIGMVIGHEISHGFDDQGAQYDGDGNLRDWWTKDDHDKFAAKTKALVEEYNAFEPVPGYHINGELTLGENIADNSGLAVAFKAYQLSLDGKPAPMIDGFSGDQRFYLGFAQAWRTKLRDNYAIELTKTDPHSIPVDRVLGSLVNQPGFYTAFDVKAGDKMYVEPEKRVGIW